jgi:hypothetical protein
MNVKSILAAGALALLASTAWAADTIKIGNIVVTAGFLKSVGEPTLTAVDIAVDEINAAGGINGKPIELIRFDTGSDPKQASVGARKLAQDDEVLAIVGPFSSGESAVALNDAERLKVLMMPTSASAPGLTDGRKYGWRLTEDEFKQFGRLLKSLKANGIKAETAEIVYISEEVVSNAAGTKLYPALLKENGITHGDPIPVQYKSFDMSAQAAQILASNPDLVAIAALPESASKVIGSCAGRDMRAGSSVRRSLLIPTWSSCSVPRAKEPWLSPGSGKASARLRQPSTRSSSPKLRNAGSRRLAHTIPMPRPMIRFSSSSRSWKKPARQATLQSLRKSAKRSSPQWKVSDFPASWAMTSVSTVTMRSFRATSSRSRTANGPSLIQLPPTSVSEFIGLRIFVVRRPFVRTARDAVCLDQTREI